MSAFASHRQFATFVAVGLAATATHTGAALGSHQVLGLTPLVANLIGYGCAIAVSYVGNARLTFRRPILLHDQFARFLTISLGGLALNEGLVFVFTGPLHAPFYLALVPVVVVTPLLTFTLARLWAFIERGTGAV